MQNLQIDKKNALRLFPTASTEFKQMLIDTFGEKFFQQKITDRVKTFEDACEVLDVSPTAMFAPGDTADEIAYKKLKVIIAALNEGWKPNWFNTNDRKWYPWFEWKSGFGFSRTGYGRWDTNTGVGSRLCFKSSELAEYAAKQFISIYQDFLTLQ